MRIVIDAQGAQGESRDRGIGRYSFELARAVARNRGPHEVLIALSDRHPDSIMPLRAAFDGVLPREALRVWTAPGPLAGVDPRNAAHAGDAELIREAFLASLNPDVVLVANLFEGFGDDGVTSIGRLADLPTAVVLYDLIPLMHPDEHLHSEVARSWYRGKIDALLRADLLLAISRWTADEAVEALALDPARVRSISAAAAATFRPLDLRPAERRALMARHGLTHDFLLYAGNLDSRKNVDNLITAYGRLPHAVRRQHHLAVVGRSGDRNRERLARLARAAGLSRSEVVFLDFVPDSDLRALYSCCKAFVFPSRVEGFGLPPLEAMQCGAAVIASDASSLPEVVGRADALFDPGDVADMAARIERVLTDDGFRAELRAHGIRQAQGFSWDLTAERAIRAMEDVFGAGPPAGGGVCAGPRRMPEAPADDAKPRLAWVAPGPPDEAEIALLEALGAHYAIEVVAERAPDDGQHPAPLPVRARAWFETHWCEFDRVVYRLADTADHRHVPALLARIPGVLFLDDFAPPAVLLAAGPQAWAGAVLASHGAQGLAALARHAGAPDTPAFPANLELLQDAAGVIVARAEMRQHAEDWYGPGAASDWAVVEAARPPAERAAACRAAIEAFEAPRRRSARQLLDRLMPAEASAAAALAGALAVSFPPRPRLKSLFVDVSTTAVHDARTGIQRVVRSILIGLLAAPPEGFAVIPVYRSQHGGHRVALRFLERMGCIAPCGLPEDLVDPYPGDVLLGLDLVADRSERERQDLARMHRLGVRVVHVIYDLLPIRLPHHFAGGADWFADWLRSVVSFDGVFCISKAVADDVAAWMAETGIVRASPLEIGWFHLGADVTNSAPTGGMPAEAAKVLDQIARRPSFLMVATIEPRKGHRQTLDAFERLWAEGVDANLVLVGRQGWLVDELAERLRGHAEAGRRLFWPNEVSDEYLERIYAASTCLITASEGEGFGLPLIEAAQHRLPILARDLPVFREVAGAHAAYFEGTGADDLAAAVKAWLDAWRQDRHVRSEAMPWQTWTQSARQLLRAMGMSASARFPERPGEA